MGKRVPQDRHVGPRLGWMSMQCPVSKQKSLPKEDSLHVGHHIYMVSYVGDICHLLPQLSVMQNIPSVRRV